MIEKDKIKFGLRYLKSIFPSEAEIPINQKQVEKELKISRPNLKTLFKYE